MGAAEGAKAGLTLEGEMGYHDLSQCTLTAEERRNEADDLLSLIDLDRLTERELDFAQRMGMFKQPVSVKQLFWLRDIKAKQD